MSKLASLTSVSQMPLEILYQRASRPPKFQGESPEPELGALVTAREPAAVRELLPLAVAGPRAWRARIRSAAAGLLGDLLDDLPVLDPWLREVYPSVAPQPDEWSTLSPQILAGFDCANAEDWQVLGLCASHRSGYVREQALKQLARGPAEIALPFLLIGRPQGSGPGGAGAVACRVQPAGQSTVPAPAAEPGPAAGGRAGATPVPPRTRGAFVLGVR